MSSRTLVAVCLAGLFGSASLYAQEHDHAGHEMATSAVTQQVNPNLPPGEEGAKAALESSPRHSEFVDVPLEGSKVPIRTWVVYPERKEKAPVVIVIHEIFGLSDWLRAVADFFAKEGFIAVAPDLISGMGPGGGGTDSAKSRDDVVKLIRGLTPEETTKRLHAVRTYALQIPSASGKIATAGFCWGGSASYAYATDQPGLDAAVAFYGTSPAAKDLERVKAPVLGLYGGDDARVNATIEPASAVMKKLGKVYEYEIYDGAGHGFLRAQTGRDGANMHATEKAWPRAVEFLRRQMADGR